MVIPNLNVVGISITCLPDLLVIIRARYAAGVVGRRRLSDLSWA